MSMRSVSRRFLRDEEGQATVDFVVTLLPFILVVMTIIEVSIIFFVSETTQKAAQLGARLAATQDPIHTAVPDVNAPNPTLLPAERQDTNSPCFQPDGLHQCQEFTTAWVCDGSNLAAACDVAGFNRLTDEVQRLYPALNPADLSVAYTYRRLGTLGGPFIPEITVRIASRPVPINFLGALNLIDQLNAVEASAFAEDLSTLGS